MGKACWRSVPQRAVRSFLVVISAPFLDFASRVVETGEPVSVQALIPQPSVEAFHVGVLHRFAWLNEFQSNPAFFAPSGQSTAAKLWPMKSRTRERNRMTAALKTRRKTKMITGLPPKAPIPRPRLAKPKTTGAAQNCQPIMALASLISSSVRNRCCTANSGTDSPHPTKAPQPSWRKQAISRSDCWSASAMAML
jgi:hypothetical protein